MTTTRSNSPVPDSVQIGRDPGTHGYRINATQFLASPRDAVFAFFSDAFQLESITPPWLHFSVLTPRPINIQRGTLIDYRLRLHGIPLRWQSRISIWEPPVRFVDEQMRGPYRRWYHEHVFEECNGGTLCHDYVDYAVYGGRLINALLVQSDLQAIFTFRQRQLRRIFEAKDATDSRT